MCYYMYKAAFISLPTFMILKGTLFARKEKWGRQVSQGNFRIHLGQLSLTLRGAIHIRQRHRTLEFSRDTLCVLLFLLFSSSSFIMGVSLPGTSTTPKEPLNLIITFSLLRKSPQLRIARI